jgi:hypothetical protein
MFVKNNVVILLAASLILLFDSFRPARIESQKSGPAASESRKKAAI